MFLVTESGRCLAAGVGDNYRVTDVLLKSILSFKNLVQRILGLVNKISVRIFSEMTSRRQARIKGSYSTNETTCVILTLRIL